MPKPESFAAAIGSGPVRELREVGLALLVVGVAALLSLRGLVEEEGGVACELLQAGLAVAVGVKGRLEAPDRHLGIGQDLAAPLHGLFLEALEGDDGVDEAHLEGLSGVVGPAEEPDLPRLLLADDAGQVSCSVAAIEGADLGSCLHEASVLRSDGQVAHDVQDVPASDRPPRDHRYDRLGAGSDLALKVKDVQPLDARTLFRVSGFPPDALVSTGAESFRPLARKDDHTYLVVVAGVVECSLHLLDGKGPEGVSHLGAVYCNLGDALGLVVSDVRELSCFLPIYACHGERLYGLEEILQ